jgi:DNA-binding NarL/FixJ family response regulator
MEEVPHVRVLVVDDSETAQEAVFALMELEPLIELVGRANDGVEAIEAVANLNPDLVIMAVDMPYLDGLQTSLILARYYPDVLIALMSSHDNPKIREQGRWHGADAFIPKPELVEGMHRMLAELFPSQFQLTATPA